MALNLKHQNKVQLIVRFRNRYRAAEKHEACRLAWRMLKLLADGDVTQAQMLNAWNMTQAEWDVKKIKLQGRADKWVAHIAAQATMDVEGTD